MEFINHRLSGVIECVPTKFHDERGYFYESYNQKRFAANGIPEDFVQDNFSFSVNSLNNKINESVSDLDKINYFGTQRGDTFYPQRVRISSGIAYYDMRITFDSIYDQNNFVVKCYEIS